VQPSRRCTRPERTWDAQAGAEFEQLTLSCRQVGQAAHQARDLRFQAAFAENDSRARARALLSFDRRELGVAATESRDRRERVGRGGSGG
jgi:hypothetical protein